MGDEVIGDSGFVRRLYLARDLRSVLLPVPISAPHGPPPVLWTRFGNADCLTPVWLLTPTLVVVIRLQAIDVDARAARGELTAEKVAVAIERYEAVAEYAERVFTEEQMREAREVVRRGEAPLLAEPPRLPRWCEPDWDDWNETRFARVVEKVRRHNAGVDARAGRFATLPAAPPKAKRKSKRAS